MVYYCRKIGLPSVALSQPISPPSHEAMEGILHSDSQVCSPERRMAAGDGFAPPHSPSKGDVLLVRRLGNKWWPARVTRPVLRIKSPLHHFNACRPKIGARGRVRTCTGDALDVVPLLVGLHERNLELPPGIAPSFLPYQRSASLKMLWGRENWCPQPDSHRQPDA